MGDNGAGKSTLVKIIAGNFPASHGTVSSKGARCISRSPSTRAAIGIEVVYQDLALADNLSAAANVFLGRELNRKFGPFKLLDHTAMNRRARWSCSANCSPRPGPSDLVRQMSGGQRQAVAIARTRLANAKLVLMDEPTAAISVRQVERGARPDPPAEGCRASPSS